MKTQSRSISQLQGRVLFERMLGPKSIQATVQKKISRWMSKQRFMGTQKSDPRYVVIFSRDEETPMVDCRIEVRWGSQTWIGNKFGYGTEEALKAALTAMGRRLTGQTAEGSLVLGAA
jgi:thermostable 8-oxoguanine DNA glycosylase